MSLIEFQNKFSSEGDYYFLKDSSLRSVRVIKLIYA